MTQSIPKLEVRHLAVLVAIDSARTFADAAHMLSITPSALSHRLREAERRLALPLLTGSGGRRLNDAGKRMLLAARRCLAEMELAEREARSAGRSAREVVRLGASTWCSYGWLPDLLRRLEADEPKIDVEVIMEVSLDPITALRDRRIDLAVMPARARGRELITEHLFDDELVAVLHDGHPKAKRRQLEVRDLVPEAYVTETTVRETGREYELLFEPLGLRPARVLQAGRLEAVMALVRAGLGITVTTRASASPFVAAGKLCLVPIAAPVARRLRWYALVRREHETAALRVARTLAAVTRKAHSGRSRKR